jgi:peptidoglycan/LPS O-acetylase OafA/YrhL
MNSGAAPDRAADAAPPFRLGYQPALDGIRAVAVLAVMVGHAAQISGWRIGSGGGIGVFIFFVLSGFLITALLIEERDRTGTNRLVKFYARRALRLLPALVVVLAFCGLYRLLSSSQHASETADAIPSAMFYFANFYRIGSEAMGALAHTWSLAVEEQFYLLWPIMVIVIGALAKPRVWKNWVLVVALTGAVASQIERLALRDHASLQRLSVAPDTAADGLLWGCATALVLYIVSDAGRQRMAAVARLLVVPGALLLLVWIVWLPGGPGGIVRYGQLLVALASAVVITFIVLAPAGPMHRLLSTRPAIEIGRRSYGLYLWHWVVLTVALSVGLGAKPAVFLEFTLTFVIAWLSFALVEQPFLRLKGRFATDRVEAERVASWPAELPED